MANAMPFRFSTKYEDNETDLLYYGYRYYSASTGRWLNRDPLEERSEYNLYGFLQNCPTFRIDTDGRNGRTLPIPPPDKRPVSKKIQVCQRDIEHSEGGDCWDKCSIGVANFWQGHTYLQILDDSGDVADTRGSRFDWGDKGEGPWPEPPGTKPNYCSTCRKTTEKLSHGSGKGKAGTDASDEEIWDCIKNHKLTRHYGQLRYNCNDWTKEAEKACGIQCPF